LKQSNKKKDREVTAFLYVRLSRDDNFEGDSYSIQNQKKLLSKAAKEKGYTNLVTFCDDGVSGVTMHRPGFSEMLSELSKGHAAAVFVKDMSRLGRNYIEVGRLTEEFFPEHDIRLVSVADNLDSDEGESELTPIRNLFNEWYARDISKKRRISNKIKGTSGEPLGLPPYGYIKDPDNPKRWIVDEEAASVVRRIYSMTLSGIGVKQIAANLADEKIPTPVFYWRSKGINRAGRVNREEPHLWNKSTVTKILAQQEYCGDVINFKTFSKSYKNKKRIENAPENMAVFKDVHEPVIERGEWQLVQQKRQAGRKRPAKDGEKSMFSGLLKCSDCGRNLHFHFNQKKPEIKYFNCSNHKSNRGTCEKTHYVRLEFLEEVVLREIRRLTQFASRYEREFIKAALGQAQQSIEAEQKAMQKELKALQKRDAELDSLFERIYEDSVSGKLSEERFAKMSYKYECEQGELSVRIKRLKAALDDSSDKSGSADMFIAQVQKYTRAKKLSERMLTELIERIEVYHAEKIDGVHVQRLKIHYNCVGSMEIPGALPLPQPEVLMQTRKGVAVSYSSNENLVNF